MKIAFNKPKCKALKHKFSKAFTLMATLALLFFMSFSDAKQNVFLSSVSKSHIEESFNFSHKYVMQVDDGKKTTDLEYYLAPTGNYFATQTASKNGKSITTTVMDIANNKMHMYMDNNGDKTRMSMSLNFKSTVKHTIDETEVTITPSGTTKTILGYKCDGYNVKGKDVEGTVWVTQDAEISFAKAFYKSDPSQSTDPNWKKIAKGLTLKMDMVDTSKRKPKSITMTCVALEKVNLSINSNDYKKLM